MADMTPLEKKFWDCCCTTNRLLAKVIGTLRGGDRRPAQDRLYSIDTSAIGEEIVKADPNRTMLLISSGTAGASFYPSPMPAGTPGWMPGTNSPMTFNARDHCDLVTKSFVSATATATTWNVIEFIGGCFAGTLPQNLTPPGVPISGIVGPPSRIHVSCLCDDIPLTLHMVTADILGPSCLGGLAFDIHYVGNVAGKPTWRATNSQCGGQTVVWEARCGPFGWELDVQCNGFSTGNASYSALGCNPLFFDGSDVDPVGHDCGTYAIRITITE